MVAVTSEDTSRGHINAPFHLLAKPSGAASNRACDYCFFTSKSRLYPGQRQRMSDDVLRRYLRELFAAHPDGDVAVAFQGGEPTLMGIGFFERAVALVEEYRRPGQRPLFTVQTNGTLVDREWAEFFARNGFLVGVSIDGPADVHDTYRHDRTGVPTHGVVMAAIGELDAAGAEWNALATISRAGEGRGAEVYRFLRDEAGARFIQFIPIAERSTDERGTPYGDSVTDRSISPEGYGDFLVDVFDEWVRRDVGEVFVQDFDGALAAWAGESSAVCVHSPECGRALCLEFNGDVYSCDHFVDPNHLLGSIEESSLADLVNSERQIEFGRRKSSELPRDCVDCQVEFACRGGCPKDRFVIAESGGHCANYLCEGYRRFYLHIDRPMRLMAELLRRGEPPAAIVHLMAGKDRALAQVTGVAGRNDLCPCGSGRTFDRCHGRREGR
ncbi:MAG: anaerobic sulfatase maturase [Coriobacteriales bacterium]|nr:anaerobic sulfatase maturase [Coriobacteriales bacterium]